ANYWRALSERDAARASCVSARRHPPGSRPREHSIDPCARPSGNRGGCGRFTAAIRTYSRWAVYPLELDGAADLPAVCVRLKPDWEDAGFHFERSRNLGTAAAAGIESGDCSASVRVEFTTFSW